MIPITVFIQLKQSLQVWAHIRPKLRYPDQISRKFTCIKSQLCLEMRPFPHQSKVLGVTTCTWFSVCHSFKFKTVEIQNSINEGPYKSFLIIEQIRDVGSETSLIFSSILSGKMFFHLSIIQNYTIIQNLLISSSTKILVKQINVIMYDLDNKTMHTLLFDKAYQCFKYLFLFHFTSKLKLINPSARTWT